MRKALAPAALIGLAAVAACNTLVGLADPGPIANDAGGDSAPPPGTEAGTAPPPADTDAGEGGTDASPPAPIDGGEEAPPPLGTGDAGDDAAPCAGVDLTSDTKNCGACGHDCGGARCSASLCELVPIAGWPLEERGLNVLYGLTLMNGILYGTDWYRPYCAVYAVGQYASVTQPQAFLSYHMSSSADGITNDGHQVFFSIYANETTPVPNASAGVYSLDAEGTPWQIYSGPYVDQLAADSDHLYWSDHTNYVYSADKSGGQLQSFLTTTVGSHLVASGGWLYFTTNGASVRAQPTALAQFTIVSDVGTPTVFDVGATDIYWFDAASGALRTRPLLLTPSVDITPPGGVSPPSGDAPLRLMVGSPDSANLYLLTTSAQSGEIYRLKSNASSPAQLLVRPNDGIYGLTQNGATLFFTTYGSGNLQAPHSMVARVQKPAL